MEEMSHRVWQAVGMLTVAIWTYLALFRRGFWRLRERLQAVAETQAIQPQSVAAVIPARNEQGLIGRTVQSLRAQNMNGSLRIIVADDESTDRTAEEARAAGASVVGTAPRPAEWKGKLWAVSEGIRHAGAQNEYFLLTDADIEYQSPEVLRALIARAEAGFDLVSVMVRLRCESMAEKALVPAFVFFFFKLYPPGTPAAAGGCILIRRAMLERIGGIGSIRTALIDDCALARRVASFGGRVWLGVSDLPVCSVREYGRAAEIRAMIARSAFAQLRHSVLLLAGTVVGMAITYIAPIVLLFSGDATAAACGALAWVIGACLFWPAVREYRAPVATIFCLPAIAAFYLWATVESAFRYWTGRGGLWKGRVQDSLQ